MQQLFRQMGQCARPQPAYHKRKPACSPRGGGQIRDPKLKTGCVPVRSRQPGDILGPPEIQLPFPRERLKS